MASQTEQGLCNFALPIGLLKNPGAHFLISNELRRDDVLHLVSCTVWVFSQYSLNIYQPCCSLSVEAKLSADRHFGDQAMKLTRREFLLGTTGATLGTLAPTTFAQDERTFDLLIRGGTVIDPASGLNAVRDIGIRGWHHRGNRNGYLARAVRSGARG